jgi:hypothetical protein
MTVVNTDEQMSKRIIIMYLLLFLSYHIYAFEHKYGSGDLSLGTLGFCIFPEKEYVNGYVFGRVLDFTFQSYSGLGITISPFNFFVYNSDVAYLFLTFINTSIFYNLFRDEHFILGPVGSINAINNRYPDFLELHTGITFSMRNFFEYDFYKNSIFGFTLLTVEAGYRYNNKGANGFYASISMDFISALYGYLAGEKKDAAEKYQKEHPPY